jgi:hypothetical protein
MVIEKWTYVTGFACFGQHEIPLLTTWTKGKEFALLTNSFTNHLHPSSPKEPKIESHKDFTAVYLTIAFEAYLFIVP